MAYEDDLQQLNNSLALLQQQQQFRENMKLAEDDLDFGKEAFAQQMALANQQFDWNQRVANRNYNWQKTQWEYQKQLNNLAMQREDSAFQRARADLEKAGLSPLMLSSGAGAQALNSGTAPQYDVSGVNTAYGAKQDALERRRQQINENRQYRFQQKQANRQLALQSASMALQVEKQTQELVSSYYDNKLKKGQIERYEHENKFYREHGFQQVTLATVLSDFLNRDSTKNAMESIASMGDKFTSAMSDVVNALQGKGDKVIYTSVPDFKEALSKQGLNETEQQVLIDAVEAEAQAPLHKIALRDLDGVLNRVYWALAEKFHKK